MNCCIAVDLQCNTRNLSHIIFVLYQLFSVELVCLGWERETFITFSTDIQNCGKTEEIILQTQKGRTDEEDVL